MLGFIRKHWITLTRLKKPSIISVLSAETSRNSGLKNAVFVAFQEINLLNTNNALIQSSH